jgi:hypothetical protein
MKCFPLLIICLLATTCFGIEEVDPELLPLGRNPSDDLLSVKDDENAARETVEYEFSRAAEIQRSGLENGFYVYDQEAVRKGVRRAEAISRKFQQHAFEKFLSKSGLFLRVGTNFKDGPDFLYVFVKPRQKGEAIHYFQSVNLRAIEWPEWENEWKDEEGGAPSCLFQCQVPGYELLFWVKALRNQKFVVEIQPLTPVIYYPQTLEFSVKDSGASAEQVDMTSKQKAEAFTIMKDNGLFFGLYHNNDNRSEPASWGEPGSWITVPEGSEEYFIGLFREHGINMAHAGERDSEEVDIADLQFQSSVGDGTAKTPLSQQEIMMELEKYVKVTLPLLEVVERNEAMILFKSPDYFGPKVISSLHNKGWERVRLIITASRLDKQKVSFFVGLSTWVTQHGDQSHPPEADNLNRVGEPGTPPIEVQDERDYGKRLVSQIKGLFADLRMPSE